MTPSERWLMMLLRVVGTAAALAVVAVFMPMGWIDWCHRSLGFGPFPEEPVAEYLARCTSLFYVLVGVVHWWLSLDVRRYGRVIAALGIVMLAAGMVVLWIDIRAGMPPWWTVLDGPFGVAMGAVYLVLQFRSRVEVYQAGEAEETGPAPEPSAEAAGPAPEPSPDVAESFGEVAKPAGEGPGPAAEGPEPAAERAEPAEADRPGLGVPRPPGFAEPEASGREWGEESSAEPHGDESEPAG